MKTIILIFILPFFVFAQEIPVRWNGELRLRTEADGRDFNLNTAPNLYTLSRIRLGAEFRPSSNVSITLTMQDSRRFGEEASTTSNNKNLDLYEGYAKIDSFLLPQFTLQFGRMAIAVGSDRIIGKLGWNNVGKAFDGMLVHFGHGDALLDLFGVNISDMNAVPDPVNGTTTAFKRDNGTAMFGGYYTNPFSSEFLFNAYALNELNKNRTIPGTNDLDRTTAGTHLKGSVSGFFYDAEAAYQFGKEKGTVVSAWMAALSLGTSYSGSIVTSASLNLDIISGTEPGATEMNTFVPPYPTGHKFFGAMDYFINFPLQTFNRGITDAYLRCALKPADKITATVTLHHFITQQKLTATDDSRDLGQEVDIITIFKYSASVSFEFGTAAFDPNTLMRRAFNSSDISYWSYLTTQIGF